LQAAFMARKEAEVVDRPDEERTSAGPLVSVVVPAYNAARTIEATLRSARAQTHRNLEIILVDDGSADNTVEIAEAQARADPRVRIISQVNGGVAAARNTGILAAKGEFVAPVDADDIWAPAKIERQLELMTANANATLCYTWFACLDHHGRVVGYGGRHNAHGNVLQAMCRTNLVGNGSGAMMRRESVLAAGLYDPSLRARGAQGCEDYKLYLTLAEAGDVVVVEDFLTGYRVTPHNMSSDIAQMCRSHLLVLEEFGAKHPHLTPYLEEGRRQFGRWLVMRAVRELRIASVPELFLTLARVDRDAALALAAHTPGFVARRAVSRLRRLLPAKARRGEPQPFPIGMLDG
jgi:glycosyltransferase involved in cell wall biosynthesis